MGLYYLHDSSLVDDGDAVGPADRAEPMRDHHHRAARQQALDHHLTTDTWQPEGET